MGSPRSCCICVGTVDVSVGMDGGYIRRKAIIRISQMQEVGLYG